MRDRIEIRDLLGQYCRCVDEYALEELSSVFTSDCTMDQGPGRGGPISGRAAVLSGMKQRQGLFRRTQHQMGQVEITFTGEGAEVLSYVTAWHQFDDLSTAVARLRYVDRLVSTSDGWRIRFRRSEALGVDGFDEAQWNWVERGLRPPQE